MVCELSLINKSMAAAFGSKTACLGELANAGIPVPTGFGLSIAAFHSFLAYNAIDFNPACFLAENDRLRQQLLAGSFPADLEQALIAVYDNLQTPAPGELIVRSSALCEDATRLSFAGIFDSVAGVKTPGELLVAIKKCYASLLTDRTLAYALAGNLSFGQLRMGVLIQKYIPGSPSGVLFTADPVHMRPEVMVINWVDGPCSRFMSGEGVTQRLYVEKTGSLKEATEEFSPSRLSALVKLGRTCEELFGSYQDLEWTFAGETLYALQSRPVTTFKNPDFPVTWQNSADREYTWYKSHGPLKPLEQESWLACRQIENQAAHRAGLSYFYVAMLFVNGYLYMRNADLPEAEVNQQQYNAYVADLKQQGLNVFTDLYLPRILEIHASLQPKLHQRLSNPELKAFLDASFNAMQEINGMHWLIVQGCLEKDTIRLFREKYRLSSSETSLLLHQPTWLTRHQFRLMQMVKLIKTEPQLTALFQQHTSPEVIYAHLACLPAASGLLLQLQAFLEDYGLYQLAWNDSRILLECPWEVAGYLRRMLQDRDTTAFFAHQQQLARQQATLLAALPARLGPVTWQEWQQEIPFYRKAFLVRDNHAHYIDATAGGFYRWACVQAGKRLAEQKKIAHLHDWTFLRLAEIKQALTDEKFEPAAIIIRRKQTWLHQQTLQAPPWLGREPQPAGTEHKDRETDSEVMVLEGMSGLAASVQAEVRFKKDLPDLIDGKYIFVFKHVRELDFNTIIRYTAGLVFEWGSPFEHVGIWARENNIPALFGVKGVTDQLASGDLVALDGVQEVIRIIRHA